MLTSCPYLSCKWPWRETRGKMTNAEQRDRIQQSPRQLLNLHQPWWGAGSFLPFTTCGTITQRGQRRQVVSGGLCPPCAHGVFQKARTSALPHSPTGLPFLGCCCGTSDSPGEPEDKIRRNVAWRGWHSAGRVPVWGKRMDLVPYVTPALGEDVQAPQPEAGALHGAVSNTPDNRVLRVAWERRPGQARKPLRRGTSAGAKSLPPTGNTRGMFQRGHSRWGDRRAEPCARHGRTSS